MASNGKQIELLDAGKVSKELMFQNAIEAAATLTWILRLVGVILMAIGFTLLFAPLAVLADIIPFLAILWRWARLLSR